MRSFEDEGFAVPLGNLGDLHSALVISLHTNF